MKKYEAINLMRQQEHENMKIFIMPGRKNTDKRKDENYELKLEVIGKFVKQKLKKIIFYFVKHLRIFKRFFFTLTNIVYFTHNDT